MKKEDTVGDQLKKALDRAEETKGEKKVGGFKLPNTANLPNLSVDAVAASGPANDEEREKIKAAAVDIGGKKAIYEFIVNKYSRIEAINEVLTAEEGATLERARKGLKDIEGLYKGLHSTIQSHAELAHLIEMARLMTKEVVSTKDENVVDVAAFFQKAVGLNRAKEVKWDPASVDAHRIKWNGVIYAPGMATKGNIALFTELRKLCDAVGELRKQRKLNHEEAMRARATISLANMLLGDGVEGFAYVFFPSFAKKDGKTGKVIMRIPSGSALYELRKDRSGEAVIVIADAEGRMVRGCNDIALGGAKYLPLAYVKNGKPTRHIDDKKIFFAYVNFIKDINVGLELEARKKKDEPIVEDVEKVFLESEQAAEQPAPPAEVSASAELAEAEVANEAASA